MIFDEGGFVRTLWYGRSRIWQKARKYRHFGGFERNYLWLAERDSVSSAADFTRVENIHGLFAILCGDDVRPRNVHHKLHYFEIEFVVFRNENR